MIFHIWCLFNIIMNIIRICSLISRIKILIFNIFKASPLIPISDSLLIIISWDILSNADEMSSFNNQIQLCLSKDK